MSVLVHAGDPPPAATDLGTVTPGAGPDGAITADDIIAFIEGYTQGCP